MKAELQMRARVRANALTWEQWMVFIHRCRRLHKGDPELRLHGKRGRRIRAHTNAAYKKAGKPHLYFYD